MQDRAHVDFETRSEVDLTKCGTVLYAQDPSTEVLCMAYTLGDDPVKLWLPGEPFPEDLEKHIEAGKTVVGHNVGGFEWYIWNNIQFLFHDWPYLDIEQCEDTMAMAYAMALPGHLAGAAAATGIKFQKDMKGHRIMLQLCKPRRYENDRPVWWTKKNAPEKYQALYDYCKMDVEVERELDRRLMRLSEKEQKLWILDHEINSRGVSVDSKAARNALELVEFEKARLDEEMREVTGKRVATCMAISQLVSWLTERGLAVNSVAKENILNLLEKDNLPDDCRQALLLRQESAKTSTAKINAMLNNASLDGRMKGLFQFDGASTGRWAGRRVQLHNLPRPEMIQEDIEDVFRIIHEKRTFEASEEIRLMYGPVLSVLSSCVRGFLVASEGKELVASDYSSVESRVLAWLAGQNDKLEMFRTDGRAYEHAASQVYGVPIGDIAKDDPRRQVGKVVELAFGFGGGLGAFKLMGKGYGVKLEDSVVESIKERWRAKNADIVNYWYRLEDQAMRAVMSPGNQFAAGPRGREVTYLKNGSFLWCKLPSNRVICYPYPRIQPVETPWGQTKNALTYMGVDSLTKKWVRIKTYGGKLAENVTQAVSACLLRESMLKLKDRKIPIVLHVHDEIVTEVNRGTFSVEEMESLMREVPSWAMGLPIGASGWKGIRFRK